MRCEISFRFVTKGRKLFISATNPANHRFFSRIYSTLESCTYNKFLITTNGFSLPLNKHHDNNCFRVVAIILEIRRLTVQFGATAAVRCELKYHLYIFIAMVRKRVSRCDNFARRKFSKPPIVESIKIPRPLGRYKFHR